MNTTEAKQKGLIAEIEACAGHGLAEKTIIAVSALLASIPQNEAVKMVDTLCALDRLPDNIYGKLRAMWNERKPVPKSDEQSSPREPIADPQWVKRFWEVSAQILKYHLGDMARWNAAGLQISSIPENGCPDGWWPVIEHFCVTRFERDVKYCAEFTGAPVGHPDRWKGTVKTVITCDTEIHDRIYLKCGNDLAAQLRYMDCYEAALMVVRKEREIPDKAVISRAYNEPEQISAVLNNGGIK
ncbi:MAG: hypothetical protein LBB56_02955 [Chitinispirillales bacterium]|nr:hypothetical protein [Chitinispirillales bacterium]